MFLKEISPKGRLLLVITGLARGGAETQAKELAIRMQYRGWEVQMVSLLPPEAYMEDLTEAGVRLFNLGMKRGIPDPRAPLKLAELVRRFKPHIVHGHMIHANLLARISRLLAPIPVLICTAHNTLEIGRTFRSEKATHWVYRLTDPLCDLTTQVAREGFERFRQGKATSPQKLFYLPNGVDTARHAPRPEVRVRLRREFGLPEESFVWLTVGRLEPVKDHATLLEAFARIAGAHDKVVLFIVGTGSLEASLKNIAHQLGLKESVRFLGLRTDIPDLLTLADGFVLSSIWEGMPMVLLEAHASGLPIVATDVGGNRDVVKDGISGFLVPPKNPETLASAMRHLMTLPKDRRQEMGLAGRALVEKEYSLERIVDQWEGIYLSLLRKKGFAL